MIVLLDTSTGLCKLTLVDEAQTYEYEWQADRTLADNLLSYVEQRLMDHSLTLHDITGVGVMKGPGSFTGLRIGLTIFNTIAEQLGIPIVGATGESWQEQARDLLLNGENHHLVVPEYGRPANITTPRK